MMRLFPIFLLFFYSCGSLKTGSLETQARVDEMLSAVPMVGEGRGRVGIRNQQFVFSFDALLKENTDWLLSAAIPLHGEEVMLFRDLKQATPSEDSGSFEERIHAMFEHEGWSHRSAEALLQELRYLIRFMLSAKLNLKRACAKAGEDFECALSGETGVFLVKGQFGKKISIQKNLPTGESLAVEGENFQTSKFMRTNFVFVRSSEKIFSLDLLWK